MYRSVEITLNGKSGEPLSFRYDYDNEIVAQIILPQDCAESCTNIQDLMAAIDSGVICDGDESWTLRNIIEDFHNEEEEGYDLDNHLEEYDKFVQNTELLDIHFFAVSQYIKSADSVSVPNVAACKKQPFSVTKLEITDGCANVLHFFQRSTNQRGKCCSNICKVVLFVISVYRVYHKIGIAADYQGLVLKPQDERFGIHRNSTLVI